MDTFKDFLVKQNLSKNTVSAYLTAVGGYQEFCEDITKKNLLLRAQLRHPKVPFCSKGTSLSSFCPYK